MSAASSDAKEELRFKRSLPMEFRSSKREFPGGPVTGILTSAAGGTDSIPGPGNKTLHAVSVVPVPLFFVVLEGVSRLPWILFSSLKLLKNKFNEENFKDLIGLKWATHESDSIQSRRQK